MRLRSLWVYLTFRKFEFWIFWVLYERFRKQAPKIFDLKWVACAASFFLLCLDGPLALQRTGNSLTLLGIIISFNDGSCFENM